MQKYKVTYAGLPESKQSICAASPEEAAQTFFSKHMTKNAIFVNWGFVQEKVFYFEDMEKIFPELSSVELPYVVKKEKKRPKLPLWKDFLLRLFLGN